MPAEMVGDVMIKRWVGCRVSRGWSLSVFHPVRLKDVYRLAIYLGLSSLLVGMDNTD